LSELLFKVLGPEGRSPLGASLTWPLPSDEEPGEWVEVKGKLAPHNALLLYAPEHLVLRLGPTIYVAEAEGELVYRDDYQVLARRARLVRRVKEWTEKTARLFACDCARRALARERSEGREPDERLRHVIRISRAFARGEATDRNLRFACEDAKKAIDEIAYDSDAETSSYYAAYSAMETARPNPWDAAWEAARYASLSVGVATRDACRRKAGIDLDDDLLGAARELGIDLDDPGIDDTVWAAYEAADEAGYEARKKEIAWQTKRLMRYLMIEGV
jgi:hypothetical protein